MDYVIVGKNLIVSAGITEIRFHDVCDVVSKNEIQEIALPETIQVIHDDTFFDFPGITRINIPGGIQHIGAQAFWGLDDLEALFLPITVPFVGKHAFCNCKKLTLTVLGSSGELPSGWDPEFAANIKEICFKEPGF